MKIEYPSHNFKFKDEANSKLIFDEVRRRWVLFTPEEWVRQNFLQYLITTKAYPQSLIAVERGIKLNGLQKRCDIIIYKDDTPFMIIECKEMQVGLTPDVLMQVLRYNMQLQVPYIIITNGSNTTGWKIENSQAIQISEIPAYK